MNDQKTKVIMYGNNVQLSKCSTKHIEIGDEIIGCSDMINLLDIYIDNNLTFKKHIKKKCSVAMYNLHNMRSLHGQLNSKTTQTLIYGLVISHLDYTDAIYSTLPASTIRPLIRVQNLAARLVLNSRDRDTSLTNTRHILFWLSNKERSIYKCFTILHPCVHGTGPSIISNKAHQKITKVKQLKTHVGYPKDQQGNLWWQSILNTCQQTME